MLSLAASFDCLRRIIMKAQFEQKSIANIFDSIAKLPSSKDLQSLMLMLFQLFGYKWLGAEWVDSVIGWSKILGLVEQSKWRETTWVTAMQIGRID